jgi:hypothetical protein
MVEGWFGHAEVQSCGMQHAVPYFIAATFVAMLFLALRVFTGH